QQPNQVPALPLTAPTGNNPHPGATVDIPDWPDATPPFSEGKPLARNPLFPSCILRNFADVETINLDKNKNDDDDDDNIKPSVDELWEIIGDKEGEEDGGFCLPLNVEEFDRPLAAVGG
ncbi:MAG: hypothetical protein L6R41_006369, partial [Letrouitia leprolyta]